MHQMLVSPEDANQILSIEAAPTRCQRTDLAPWGYVDVDRTRAQRRTLVWSWWERRLRPGFGRPFR